VGERFSLPIQTTPESHIASCTRLFLRVKCPGCGIIHPPPSGAEVKERVELYPFSPSRPSWPVVG